MGTFGAAHLRLRCLPHRAYLMERCKRSFRLPVSRIVSFVTLAAGVAPSLAASLATFQVGLGARANSVEWLHCRV